MEKPFLGESAWQQGSWAIPRSEGDGRAADALSKGHAENTRRDLTEAVFGSLRPHGSLGWGYNRAGDQCCLAVKVGDGGRCKS